MLTSLTIFPSRFAELEIFAVIANLVRRYKILPGPGANDESMRLLQRSYSCLVFLIYKTNHRDVDLMILLPKEHKAEFVFERDE